jgi:hypothetical protein
MKAAADNQKLIAVDKVKLHSNVMVVHSPIEHQSVLAIPLEGKVGLPIPVAAFGERHILGAAVNRDAVTGERIVHPLKGYGCGEVEDHAAPTAIVGEQG